MIELGASSSLEPTAALVAISFVSFLGGQICRIWPDKVQELADSIDGSVMFLTPQAHRALIRMCGAALSGMSLAALLAATFLI